MKNQNDLIVSIVCGVLMLGGIATLYFTKREPLTPGAAPKANLTPAALPAGTIPMTNGLPGGSNAPGGAFGAGRGFGGPGGPGGAPFGGPGGPPIGARGPAGGFAPPAGGGVPTNVPLGGPGGAAGGGK
jgi:putative polyketide hydroxylase